MEKPTRICHMQDLLGSMLKEPRYKNVICVDPELRHNYLPGRAESAVEGCRPGWLSQEHGEETLLRFLRTHCAKLALTDLGSHPQALSYMLKRTKYEPMASWCTRYRNEYAKVRRALARLQRTESTEESELRQSYFSP